MAAPGRSETVRALLDRHGRSHAQELGIDVAGDGPSALFRLLCAAVLFSARISADIATSAARALADRGWTSAEALAASSWEERAAVLNRAGYARYDERTSTMLGELADTVAQRYGGDLRRLRDTADRDPGRERAIFKELKGLGDVGVDILFRELQASWEELYPFADDRALQAARRLGLPGDADGLAGLVPREDFPRLAAALVRVALDDGYDELRRSAAAPDAGGPPSKAELYERAKRQHVPGRSKMSKRELAEAVDADD